MPGCREAGMRGCRDAGCGGAGRLTSTPCPGQHPKRQTLSLQREHNGRGMVGTHLRLDRTARLGGPAPFTNFASCQVPTAKPWDREPPWGLNEDAARVL